MAVLGLGKGCVMRVLYGGFGIVGVRAAGGRCCACSLAAPSWPLWTLPAGPQPPTAIPDAAGPGHKSPLSPALLISLEEINSFILTG